MRLLKQSSPVTRRNYPRMYSEQIWDTAQGIILTILFILALTYHSTGSDITTRSLSPCLLGLRETLIKFNCSRARINLSTIHRLTKRQIGAFF